MGFFCIIFQPSA